MYVRCTLARVRCSQHFLITRGFQIVRKVLVLSVPSDQEEKSVLVDSGTDADCSSAVVEIRVPKSMETDQHADFREFAMVRASVMCHQSRIAEILCRPFMLWRIKFQQSHWTP